MSKILPFRNSPDAKGLEFGSGGGDSGDMDTRIERLEAGMIDVKASLTRIEATLTKMDDRGRKSEIDIAELKGRVSQLPTTLQMIGFVLAVLAIAGLGKYFAT